MSKCTLGLLALAFTGASAFAQMPSPLLLKAGEDIVFKGNKWDTVICGPKKYASHDYNIVVTKVMKDCNCDTPVATRIYEDGLYKGSCRTEYRTETPDNSSRAFIDLKFINKLSDKEFEKLLQFSNIGSCVFSIEGIHEPIKVKHAFESYFATAEDELNTQNSPSKQVFVKAARNIIKDGLCGQFDELTDEQLLKTRGFLGYLDIGFEALIAEGLDADDVAKLKFPVKRLRDRFNLSIEKFVEYGYGADDLYQGGFKLKELVDAKFKLSDLAGLNIPITELSAHFTLKDFMAAKDRSGFRVYGDDILRTKLGYKASELKQHGANIDDLQYAGYNILTEIKPLFTLKEFKAVKDSYGYRKFDDSYLRRTMKYSAQELKAEGSSITDLQNAGFNILTEIKPLFTLKEFKAVKDSYGYRKFDDSDLRQTLKYSAEELKAEGSSIMNLHNAGFNILTEIKPLYTLKEFKAVKDSYGYRKFDDSYLRQTLKYSAEELKAEGASIKDLHIAGFNLLTEIKPLFKASDFVALKDSYGYKTYSTRYLREQLSFDAKELKAAGISIKELFQAGFTKQQLRDAGFTVEEVDAL